jgi:sugar/nucleoside kinase (ribokinase family)
MAVRNYLGVFGHVVLDHILAVPKLPVPDATVRVLDRNRYFGGTAGNIARFAARLGVPTALASFVGEDFPDAYRRALAAEGVDLTDLRVVRGAATPSAWIFTAPGGRQTTVIDQGPMWEAHRQTVPEHSVRSAVLVHLGTGRPAYLRKVARLAADLGKTIAFDPSQEITYAYTRTSFMELLRRADIFFGNAAEVRTALRFARLRRPEDLLRHVEQVVMTLGHRGSLVLTREGGAHRIPRVPPRRVVDVTGAGDAYRAGFYAGLSRGYDPRRCGLLGSAAASFAVEARGTQTVVPSWDEVVRRASRFAGF